MECGQSHEVKYAYKKKEKISIKQLRARPFDITCGMFNTKIKISVGTARS